MQALSADVYSEEMRQQVERLRATRAGQLALRLYREERCGRRALTDHHRHQSWLGAVHWLGVEDVGEAHALLTA